MIRAILKGAEVQMQWMKVDTFDVVDERFSYRAKGAIYSPKYQAWLRRCEAALKNGEPQPKARYGEWDGIIHVLRRKGSMAVAPAGLWVDIERVLQEIGQDYELHDARPEPDVREALAEFCPGNTARGYQTEAIDAAINSGYGILRLPIRSGKTRIASEIIHELGCRTLFVVPSKLLLEQSIKVFRKCFPKASVTQFGDGVKDDTGDIVVCTTATLMKSAPLLNETPFTTLIVDEVHHISGNGNAWRDALLTIEARYRLGMSATFRELDPDDEAETQSIWARAATGPIIYQQTMSELIRQGFLAKPLVRFVRYDAPFNNGSWTGKLIDELLVKCEARTKAMIDAAMKYAVDEGATVLFDCQRIAHARDIYPKVQAMLPPGRVAILTGESAKGAKERDEILKAFSDGRIQVIVGNLLGEGVDMPHLRVVVNMEGGCSETSTVQRLRNLNAVEGKGQAIVIEGLDKHHKTLQEWTLKRIDIYRSEEEFEVELS